MAIDEAIFVQDVPVIDAWFAVAFVENGCKARHLRIRQPEKVDPDSEKIPFYRCLVL